MLFYIPGLLLELFSVFFFYTGDDTPMPLWPAPPFFFSFSASAGVTLLAAVDSLTSSFVLGPLAFY